MEDNVIDESAPMIDYNSPDWHRVVEFLKSELEDCISVVTAHDTAERTSDFHRGRIRQIRSILDWNPHNSR